MRMRIDNQVYDVFPGPCATVGGVEAEIRASEQRKRDGTLRPSKLPRCKGPSIDVRDWIASLPHNLN